MTISLKLGAKNYIGHAPLGRIATLRLTGLASGGLASGEALLVAEWEVENEQGLTTQS
jgi:hypothetical protein